MPCPIQRHRLTAWRKESVGRSSLSLDVTSRDLHFYHISYTRSLFLTLVTEVTEITEHASN